MSSIRPPPIDALPQMSPVQFMVPCGFRFLDVGNWPPSLLRPNIAASSVLVRLNVPHREGDRKFFCRHGGLALRGDSQLPHPMSH